MTAKQEYISAARYQELRKLVNDLRDCLQHSNIESGHPLIVSVITASRANRMNLHNILEGIKEGPTR